MTNYDISSDMYLPICEFDFPFPILCSSIFNEPVAVEYDVIPLLLVDVRFLEKGRVFKIDARSIGLYI